MSYPEQSRPTEPTPIEPGSTPVGAGSEPVGTPPTSASRPESGPEPAPDGPDPLRSSRTSGAFVALLVTVVLIVLLVIFIFQNTRKVPIKFLWIDGHAPLAAALLIATAAGMSIVALVGGLRILQLRRRVKRDKKTRSAK